MPHKTTNRRRIAASVGGATATGSPAGATTSLKLSGIDQRVLTLYRRRTRARAAIDRIFDQMSAAEAKMPSWARPGPQYVLKGESQVACHPVRAGWPEVANLNQQPVDKFGRIVARPNLQDLIDQFTVDRENLGFEKARRKFAAAFRAHEERIAQQQVERERAGYTRLKARFEECFERSDELEEEIAGHAETSILALAATLLFTIVRDDEEAGKAKTSLAALRPQLVGAIADDADRVLLQAAKEVA